MRNTIRQWLTGVTGWLSLGCCLCLLLAAAEHGACFGMGTTISITLDQSSIYRDAWEAAYNGRIMGSWIAVTEHGLRDQNEIKLEGRRDGTLWPGENSWSMTTTTIYFSYSQTTGRYTFNFGPPCAQPDDQLSWNQYYKYTATIFAGTGYSSGSAMLTVINEWSGSMGMSIIDETL
jgi:hypothetical protein